MSEKGGVQVQFNHDLTLRSSSEIAYDEYGNEVSEPVDRTVLCAKGAVGRYDYYQAASVGLKAQAVVYVIPDDYQGERIAIFEGRTHTVERDYPVEDGGILYTELTLTDRIGDGNA